MLYKILMQLFSPIMCWHLHRRAARGKEDLSRLNERYGIASQKRPAGKLIWAHAASVGEAQSTITLINRLLLENPELTVLITTGTVTSARVMQQRLSDRIIHQYVPMDVSSWVEKFLDYWRPDLVLWIESELWPNMLCAVKDRGIPAIMVNGRLSGKATKRWRWMRSCLAEMLSAFRVRFVQTQIHADRMAEFHPGPYRVVGNIKFSAHPLPVDKEQLKKLKAQLKKRPLWLAASTHAGEEEIIIKAHAEILKSHPTALCVLLPRHPERAESIMRLLDGYVYARRSTQETIKRETQIYLADTIGEAGLFYRLCQVAFVGGSLVPVGGHNLVEPAQLGCAIIHGPYMHKSTSIAQAFADHSACIQVNGVSDLAAVVDGLLKDPEMCQNLISSGEAVVKLHSEVIDQVLHEIRRYL